MAQDDSSPRQISRAIVALLGDGAAGGGLLMDGGGGLENPYIEGRGPGSAGVDDTPTNLDFKKNQNEPEPVASRPDDYTPYEPLCHPIGDEHHDEPPPVPEPETKMKIDERELAGTDGWSLQLRGFNGDGRGQFWVLSPQGEIKATVLGLAKARDAAEQLETTGTFSR